MPTLLDKWRLLDAILADPAVTHGAAKVAFRLLHHCNRTTSRCDPSMATLMVGARLSERSVQRSLDLLIRLGWFEVDRGGGRHRCNAYRPSWARANNPVAANENPDAGVTLSDDETPTPASPFGGENPDVDDTLSGQNPDAGVGKPRRTCRETPTPASPKHGKEHGKEHEKSANALVHREITQSMVDIWNQVVWLPGAGKKPCRLSDKRHKALSRRLKDTFNNDIEEWRAFCGQVHSSPFLAGRKTRWHASLDWCLKPENITKILEGNYHDDEQADGAGRQAASTRRGQSKGTARTAAFLGFPDEF